MKATINRKTYNTETAEQLAYASSGGSTSDFSYWEETLHRTQKGNYFLHGEGGPLSRYSESCEGGRASCSDSAIVPLSESEALAWCEEHGCEDAIEECFNHLIEEA
jgi:hypothetical protein